MKRLLFLLMLIPAASYCQDSLQRPIMQPDSIKLIPINDDYFELKQEGSEILGAGIVMNITSFGLLFSGPLSDIGVGTVFWVNQAAAITLEIVGIVKLIRAEKKRKNPLHKHLN